MLDEEVDDPIYRPPSSLSPPPPPPSPSSSPSSSSSSSSVSSSVSSSESLPLKRKRMVLEESRPSPSFTRVPSCVVLVNILPGVKSESHAVSLQRISGNYHDFLEVVGLL